jgi:hypothetical protein
MSSEKHVPNPNRSMTNKTFDMRDGPDGTTWRGKQADFDIKYPHWPKAEPKLLNVFAASSSCTAAELLKAKAAILAIKKAHFDKDMSKLEVSPYWNQSLSLFYDIYPAWPITLTPYPQLGKQKLWNATAKTFIDETADEAAARVQRECRDIAEIKSMYIVDAEFLAHKTMISKTFPCFKGTQYEFRKLYPDIAGGWKRAMYPLKNAAETDEEYMERLRAEAAEYSVTRVFNVDKPSITVANIDKYEEEELAKIRNEQKERRIATNEQRKRERTE